MNKYSLTLVFIHLVLLIRYQVLFIKLLLKLVGIVFILLYTI